VGPLCPGFLPRGGAAPGMRPLTAPPRAPPVSGSVLQRRSSSLEEREVLAAAPVMNSWDTIQREGEPVLQLLESFLSPQGRRQKCPMNMR